MRKIGRQHDDFPLAEGFREVVGHPLAVPAENHRNLVFGMLVVWEFVPVPQPFVAVSERAGGTLEYLPACNSSHRSYAIIFCEYKTMFRKIGKNRGKFRRHTCFSPDQLCNRYSLGV